MWWDQFAFDSFVHERNALSEIPAPVSVTCGSLSSQSCSRHLDVVEFGQLRGVGWIPGIPYQPEFPEWKEKGLLGNSKVEGKLQRLTP